MFFKSTILSGLHGALPIILILTNKNVALIYIQSQFVNHKKKKQNRDCVPSGSSQHKLQLHCFYLHVSRLS